MTGAESAVRSRGPPDPNIRDSFPAGPRNARRCRIRFPESRARRVFLCGDDCPAERQFVSENISSGRSIRFLAAAISVRCRYRESRGAQSFAGRQTSFGRMRSGQLRAGFYLVWELTRQMWLAWLSFALILCNPLHLLYSGASMTDVPHACFILGSLYAALRRHWVVAAIWMAIAEGIRIEAWVFVLVLPLCNWLTNDGFRFSSC